MQCISCGYNIEASLITKNNTVTCPACNNTWFLDEFNNSSASTLNDEHKLFVRLNQLLEFHQFSDVIERASQYLDINPMSGSAHFFYFLGQAKLTIADLSTTTLYHDYRSKLIFSNAKKYQNIYTSEYLFEYERHMQELEEERRKYIAAKSKEYEMERAAKQKAAEERERELEEARLKGLVEEAKRASEDEKRRKRILIFGTVFILLLIIVGSIWVIIARQQEQYVKNINNCILYVVRESPTRITLHQDETYSIKALLNKTFAISSSIEDTDTPIRYEADSDMTTDSSYPISGVYQITTYTTTTTIYHLVGFTQYKPDNVNMIDFSGTAWSIEGYLSNYPKSSIIEDSIEYLSNGFTYYYPIYTRETKTSNSESKAIITPTPMFISFDSEKIMDFNSKETILIPEVTVTFGYPEAPELNITATYTYTNVNGYSVLTDSGFDSLYWTYHKLKLANSIMAYMDNTAKYRLSDLETSIKLVVSGPYNTNYEIETCAYVNIVQWSRDYLSHTSINWIQIDD